MRRSLYLMGLALGLLAPAVRADVTLHPLIGDGMVLQRGKPCAIWGTATAGEEVTVTLHKEGDEYVKSSSKADAQGKWKVVLPLDAPAQAKAGGPYTLKIKGQNELTAKDVYVGEVWVASGQSNMEWSVNASHDPAGVKASAANSKIRLFTVRKTAEKTPQTTVPVDNYHGKWLECGSESVARFSAVAYHFGKHLQKELDVPVGIIHTSWGGTASEEWTSQEVLDAHPEHKGKHPRQTQLYNGMIAPILNYSITGAIWYQGESNAGRAELYRTGFPLMIKNWRDDWKQGDFPFYFVQLAPFMAITKEPSDTQWAHLRDAQRHTSLTLKNTAMAVITDVGDEKDIHPRQKEPVGHRLALAALAMTYGKKIEYSGPQYEKMTVDGNKAILHFSHLGGGLVCKGEQLTGFTVAGIEKKFFNAEARIEGDTIVVTSSDVEKPTAVRFGWANYPVVNLWNKAGLPASPFRTDDWPAPPPPAKPAKPAAKPAKPDQPKKP